MLRTTRDRAKQQYHEYLKKINEVNAQLQSTMSSEDFVTVTNATEKSREYKFKKEKTRLKEKFEQLNAVRTTQPTAQRSKLKHEVFDLTKDGIDEDVKAYLQLGPDFSEVPRKLPYEKIII